ncbi:site-specific DNA-methyltransferase [Bradyrhizobium betae]|uniref:site-specific DNA-methyltransferase n=1 Tax=Bradyrhizobium betae TaxID=244734 RepID=UPI003D67E51C
MSEAERIDDTSPDMKADLLARLKSVVPEVFSDGELDVERLAELAGNAVATGPERYGLAWPGKRDAIAMLQAPSRATLVPERDQSVNFDDAQHVFIEGENLEVLKLIYRSYFGRVKLIYIDPPYNTRNDFIYRDNFADPLASYLRQTGQMTETGDMTTSAPERSGRLHSNWLSMMYPRLSMARQMLREDGFIVVSIDDAEQPNLRRLMDDAFGEENFIATLVYDRNRKNDAKLFSIGHEYMLVYARNAAFLKEIRAQLRAPKEGVEEVRAEFDRLRKEYNDDWGKVRDGILAFYKTFGEDDPRQPLARFRKVDEAGPYRTDGDISWPGGGGPRYDVPHPYTKKPCKVPKRGWVYATYDRMEQEIAKDLVVFGEDETSIPSLRRNLFEKDDQVMKSVIFSYAQTASQQFDALFGDKKVFDNPKSYSDLERLVSYLSEPGDYVMDFFAGSNTSFHGLIRADKEACPNRRMISVQFPEPIRPGSEVSNTALAMGFKTIADISRERARLAIQNEATEDKALGFRAFRLTSTNIRRWPGIKNTVLEEYLQQIDAFSDTLIPGWKAEDVVWEVALREGFPLTAAITQIADAKLPLLWRVRDDERGKSFTICLADHLDLEMMTALNLSKSDIFVCRDIAISDTVAANLALQCTLKVL